VPDIVIQAENLGKKYTIGHQTERGRYVALRDVLVNNARNLWRTTTDLLRGKPIIQGNDLEEVWALKDVSFEIRRGEAVGIIGRNGAGKSTLLKILSRITEPSAGRVTIKGRVASLLEVGTGFHPELTGRENIYLNGAILGMTRAEVKRKFDEIVAFAEIEKFLDTPVKRYSSGMYVRLAFAVAAHLEPEILLVDEVLAVGDAGFQKKSLGKMDEVAKTGRTVLFISHNMSMVQRLCDRGLLLDRGRVSRSGPISDVVAHYQAMDQCAELGHFNPHNREGVGWARVSDVRMFDDEGQAANTAPSDAGLVFEVDVGVTNPEAPAITLRGLVMEIMFFSEQGQPLMSVMNVDYEGASLPACKNCRVQVRLPGATFIPGRYRLDVFVGIPYLQHVDHVRDAYTFEISSPIVPWRPYDLYAFRGHMYRRAYWNYLNGVDDDDVSLGLSQRSGNSIRGT
jgi:lipopolysaccharide transport system ATP-binding protein